MNRPDHDRHLRSQRAEAALRLEGLSRPDVLIIGGGVNGVGTLRDLALNGVSAVLLDSADFCAGASGASSRMAHGGLRYLEGREFRLVAESVRERNRLLRAAPHMVRPLEILVPLESMTKGFLRAVGRFLGISKAAGPLSLVVLKSALLLYERFGRAEQSLPRHRILLRRTDFPKGTPARVRALVGYHDAQIVSPEALLLEMLDEAQGASTQVAALNHADWTLATGGRFEVVDRIGDLGRWTLHPKLVVNATGGWIDRVNGQLGLQSQSVRGVKGAHLLVRNDELHARMAGQGFYFDDGSGRMVICLPTAETVLVGTTEVDTREPDDREVAAGEIDYLMSALGRLFTDIEIRPDEVVAVTTGIRPLQAGGAASATSAARDHLTTEARLPGAPEVTVLSLIGGKWTTFRAFAESVSDRILQELGRTRSVSTHDRSFPGATMPSAGDLARSTGLEEARTEKLLRRYGGAATEVAAYCAAGKDRVLQGAEDYSAREVEWLILRRAACRLEDLVLRRTDLVLSGRLSRATLKDLAAILAETLGRGADWTTAELARVEADPRIVGPALAEGRAAA
ncbi:MAG: glycerol-3-phosphate dehydrogenase/oxidase [Rhodospirillales bacterium]